MLPHGTAEAVAGALVLFTDLQVRNVFDSV